MKSIKFGDRSRGGKTHSVITTDPFVDKCQDKGEGSVRQVQKACDCHQQKVGGESETSSQKGWLRG